MRKQIGFAADCEAMRQRAVSPVVMVTERASPPGRFLKFDQPHRLLVALRPEKVQDCLQQADSAGCGHHDALRSKKSASPAGVIETSARHQDLLLWPGIDCRPLHLSIPAREFCRLRKSPHFLPVGGWVCR